MACPLRSNFSVQFLELFKEKEGKYAHVHANSGSMFHVGPFRSVHCCKRSSRNTSTRYMITRIKTVAV
jgi:hypothetical protein